MRWNVGTKLAVGFGIVVAIFIVVGVVAYQSTAQLIDAAMWRKHSYDVLMEIGKLSSHLRDVELAEQSYILTGANAHLDTHRAAVRRANQSLEQLRTLTSDNARQIRRFDQLEPMIQTRMTAADEAINLRRSQGVEAASQYIARGSGAVLSSDIAGVLSEIEGEEEDLRAQRTALTDASAKNAQLTIVTGTIAAFVLALIAAILITRNTAGPLRELTALAERIAIGDLSSMPAADTRDDEVGVLSRTFARMTESLRSVSRGAEQIAAGDLRTDISPQSDKDTLGHAFVRMSGNLREQIGGLARGASLLGSSASQIVASTAQLAAGATESATAVSETSTTVEEVRQTAHMASQKARTVSDTAQRAAQISVSGRTATDNMIAGMDRIRQQMEAIAESMMRLSEQGHTIGQIIATVEDLSAQSNLLAVNAAIEAAKAGEQGKGFGVVAQEIKALAEQSRQATDQVRTILSDIQKATANAVMATEQGAKAVEAGTVHTTAAGESIQSLSASVNEAAQAATQIAASSQQQLVGMDQVAAAMESIKQASSQNVASARQLETAARSIDELGRSLKVMVERYSV